MSTHCQSLGVVGSRELPTPQRLTSSRFQHTHMLLPTHCQSLHKHCTGGVSMTRLPYTSHTCVRMRSDIKAPKTCWRRDSGSCTSRAARDQHTPLRSTCVTSCWSASCRRAHTNNRAAWGRRQRRQRRTCLLEYVSLGVSKSSMCHMGQDAHQPGLSPPKAVLSTASKNTTFQKAAAHLHKPLRQQLHDMSASCSSCCCCGC